MPLQSLKAQARSRCLPFIFPLHSHLIQHSSFSVAAGSHISVYRQHGPRLRKILARNYPQACARSDIDEVRSAAKVDGIKHDSSLLDHSRTSELSTFDIDIHLLSPMMQHYVSTKRKVWESLGSPEDRKLVLMYRVGDFFESFFEDACALSKTCEIALTSKDAGKAFGSRAPMAGVPHHCLDEKIKMLIENNLTIAVVDQVQSASAVQSGKLVDRAVTRLITPGTVCDESLLVARRSSYLASIVIMPFSTAKHRNAKKEHVMYGKAEFFFGISYADVSTGEFKATESAGMDSLQRLLTTISPTEVLLAVPPSFDKSNITIDEEIKDVGVKVISRRDLPSPEAAEQILSSFHEVDNVESIGCRDKILCTQAAAVLLKFIRKTLAFDNNVEASIPLSNLVTFSISDAMLLDSACVKNLEIVETVRDGIQERSLQWAVDRTTTAMGTRCLRAWLMSPPKSLETIAQRQLVVESFVKDNGRAATELQHTLGRIADLERLGGRLILGRATPRELQSLCESIVQIPLAINVVRGCVEKHIPREKISYSTQSLLTPVDGNVLELARKILDALVNPAPSSIPSEFSFNGGPSREGFRMSETCIFRSGYSKVLDRLRHQLGRPENWIAAIEEREKARTSMETARIKHIKNVGYVLRVPRLAGEKIMNEDPTFFKRLGYEQVQSTKIELRFRFDDLRENEKDYHLGFSQIMRLECRMFEDLRRKLGNYARYLRSLGNRIARLDVLVGLSEVALEQQYVKPALLPESHRVLELIDVRHPVVEQNLPSGKSFVPNSFHLGKAEGNNYPDLMILCGPNAAGKSCALRSVGLVTILAQIGSYVPARSARLSVCDRIFTRVGAVDDLSRGQSTFQVEMAETACILSHATSSSLVLLDEVGRGTSAVDGISIAWSVSEFLSQRSSLRRLPPRCMFVTHYHELNHLSDLYGNIRSFHLHVEQGPLVTECESISGDHCLLTTYKIVTGPSYKSFGIAIAKRAGLPGSVIARANLIAKLLRGPSLSMSSELKKGLSPKTETCVHGRTQKAVTDEVDDEKQAYELSAFEEGYRAALTAVTADFEGLIKHLRERYNHNVGSESEKN